MPTQRTWADIVEYVSEYDKREGAVPNRTLYRLLADEAMAIVAERAGIYSKEWTNASGTGELTLTSAACPLPIDLLKLEYVEYDGYELERATTQRLDTDNIDWRTDTGDPTMYAVEGQSITLNSIPSNATGKLKIRGTAVPPQFADPLGSTAAVNPLTYLPFRHQMMICDYIISKLPVTSVTPTEYSEAGVRYAMDETRRRQQVREQAAQAWETRVEALAATQNRRQFRDFSY